MNVSPQCTMSLLLFRPNCADSQWDDKLVFCDSHRARAFLLMLSENKELLKENGGAMLLNSISLKLAVHSMLCYDLSDTAMNLHV